MLESSSKSISLSFSESFAKDDNYQVFEVNQEILDALLNSGSVQIKGNLEIID